MKTDKELVEEVEADFVHAIKNGEMSVSNKVERLRDASGAIYGAFVTVYVFVDDSTEEEE